jgi:serine/alanine adding enzyme
MMLDILTTNDINYDVWSKFVFSHPHGNIFHTPELFSVFQKTKFQDPDVLFAMNDRNQILALLPTVTLSSSKPFLSVFTRRNIAYGSLLVTENKQHASAVDKLISIYLQKISLKKSIYTELRNYCNLTHLRKMLLSYKFVYFDYLNYLIPLELPFEIMLQRISRSTRKKIRKETTKPLLEMITVQSADLIPVCYQILKSTYHHNHVPLADISLFVNAFKELMPKGMIKITLARYQDRFIATSVDLLYKKTIYGWYGGFDRAYARLLPNEMIMWHLLVWGAENGYRWYDFGGAGRPTEKYGVRDFKAKFGGNLVNFGRFSCIHDCFRYHIGCAAYQTLRKTIAVKKKFMS